jgi:hypothetical protein
MLICQYCLLKNHIGHKISKPEESEVGKYLEIMKQFKNFGKEIGDKKFQSSAIIELFSRN